MNLPNLRAEYDATTMTSASFASHANITTELFFEVLRGNEELTTQELIGIYHLLCGLHESNKEHFTMAYLMSPKLSTIAPGTAKTLQRINNLRELLTTAESTAESKRTMYSDKLRNAHSTLKAMEQEQTVTYAAYRHAVITAKDILLYDRAERRERRGVIRQAATA